MRYILAIVVISISGFAVRAYAQEGESGTSSVRVIANVRAPVDSLDRKALADIFLKRIKRWPADGPVLPVDLEPESPARRRFSEEVLSRSVAGVKNYWQQLIFSGRDLPPPELETEEEVIHYVGKTPGAIGYVSSAALSSIPSPKDIKTLSLR